MATSARWCSAPASPAPSRSPTPSPCGKASRRAPRLPTPVAAPPCACCTTGVAPPHPNARVGFPAVMMEAPGFWRQPFRPLLTSRQLAEYCVLDSEPLQPTAPGGFNHAGRFALAQAEVAKASGGWRGGGPACCMGLAWAAGNVPVLKCACPGQLLSCHTLARMPGHRYATEPAHERAPLPLLVQISAPTTAPRCQSHTLGTCCTPGTWRWASMWPTPTW